VSKYHTLKFRKFTVEFRDWRQASAHGGQLAIAALLAQFGVKECVRRERALDSHTHQGNGFAPLDYVILRWRDGSEHPALYACFRYQPAGCESA
jgi:hypothetical protein